MPAERFFLKEPFTKGAKTSLLEQEFHHLHHVMRIKKGELVELINGEGQIAHAELVSLDKHSASLLLTEVITTAPEPFSLILAQAMPRLAKLELIVEKAVELSVTELWLFPGKMSERDIFSPSQKKRLEQILISALKQCGRTYLPKFHFLPPLGPAWKKIPGHLLFGDTSPDAPPLFTLLQAQKTQEREFVIFIGPEKGFHPSETEFLKNVLGCMGVKLHTNILRVETAAITSLSLLSNYVSF